MADNDKELGVKITAKDLSQRAVQDVMAQMDKVIGKMQGFSAAAQKQALASLGFNEATIKLAQSLRAEAVAAGETEKSLLQLARAHATVAKQKEVSAATTMQSYLNIDKDREAVWALAEAQKAAQEEIAAAAAITQAKKEALEQEELVRVERLTLRETELYEKESQARILAEKRAIAGIMEARLASDIEMGKFARGGGLVPPPTHRGRIPDSGTIPHQALSPWQTHSAQGLLNPAELAKDREATAAMIAKFEAGKLDLPEGGGGRGGRSGGYTMLGHGVAAFDELASGRRRQLISTLGASLRDAGMGAAGLLTGMTALVAVMGSEAVLKFSEHMGELATNAKAAAESTGMSVREYFSLTNAMQLMGLKTNSADTALHAFAKSMAEAAADPSSKAAQGFKAFGLSQDQVKAGLKDTGQFLHTFSDRWVQYRASAEKAAAGAAIFHRSLEKIAPILNEGGQALSGMQAKAESFTGVLDDQAADAMEKVGRAASEIGNSLKLKLMRVFVEHQADILAFIHGLEGVGSAAMWLADVFLKVARGVGEFVVSAANAFVNFHNKLNEIHNAGKAMVQQAAQWIVDKIEEIKRAAIDAVPWLSKVFSPKGAEQTSGKSSSWNPFGGTTFQDWMKEKGAHPAFGDQSQPYTTADVPKPETKPLPPPTLDVPLMPKISKAGEPTAMTFAANEVAKAKELASALAQNARDASLAEAKAAVEALQHVLDVEKLTAKQRLEIETQLSNAKRILHNKELIEAQRVAREKLQAELQAIKESADISRSTMDVKTTGIKFSDIASRRPGEVSGSDTSRQNLDQLRSQAAEILAIGQKEIQSLLEVANSAQASAETRIQASREVLSVVNSTEQKLMELYREAQSEAKKTADVFSQAFAASFKKLDNDIGSFSVSMTQALLAPQHEWKQEGLKTKRVSLQGQEIRTAASKIFMGLADDFVSSVTKGLSELAAKNLAKMLLPSGEEFSGGLGSLLGRIVGGGKASTPGAEFGISTTSLQSFNAAVTQATASLARLGMTSGIKGAEGLIGPAQSPTAALNLGGAGGLGGGVANGADAVNQWAQSQAQMTAVTASAVAQRLAISQAASAKDRVMDMIDVTQWSAMESSKTATTTVNTNIRGRADLQESSSFLGRLGTMVSGWLGMETAKTGATTTGVATRTAVQEAGQAQGQAVEAANAGKSIMTSANEAAAATYANVSKIPYVGWILAPAAAAVAFGAVAAYDVVSAEGGLGQVPKDGTKAILHKDETVLPSSIATPLRSALANQTIGGLGVNMAKTTSSALSSMATGMQKMADSSGNQSIHIYPNFNVNAIDQKTGAQFLMSNMKTIVNGFAREIRNNNTNLFGKNSAINVPVNNS